MQHFDEEDIKEGLSQERLESAKEFFAYRIQANQEQLARVESELLTADSETKKKLEKSKAGYQAKIATANATLEKVNQYLGA